jgi:hypothetical protein
MIHPPSGEISGLEAPTISRTSSTVIGFCCAKAETESNRTRASVRIIQVIVVFS